MAEINVFDRISELKKRKAERDSTASVKKGQIRPIERTAADSVFDMMATTRPAVKTETEEAAPQGRYEKTTNVKERRNEAMAANVSVQTQFDSDLEARRKNLESQGYIVDEFGFIEGRLLSAPPSINKATKQKPWEIVAQADTSDITFDNMDDKIREMLDGTKQTSPVKPTQTVTQQPQTFPKTDITDKTDKTAADSVFDRMEANRPSAKTEIKQPDVSAPDSFRPVASVGVSTETTQDKKTEKKPSIFERIFKPGNAPMKDVINRIATGNSTAPGNVHADEKYTWWDSTLDATTGGFAQFNQGAVNLLRKGYELAKMQQEALSLPDVISKGITGKSIQENILDKTKDAQIKAGVPDWLIGDPVENLFDKYMGYQDKVISNVNQNIEENTSGAQKFVAQGTQAIAGMAPTAALTLLSGGASATPQIATGANVLGLTPDTLMKAWQQLKQMAPFGLNAAGNAAYEAEKAGANLPQQLTTGAMQGFNEMMTEMISFGPLQKVLGISDDIAKPVLKKGLAGVIQFLGNQAKNTLESVVSNVIEEPIADLMNNLSKKAIYDPDMPVYGEGGVIDPEALKQTASIAIAMSVIMAALGLPVSAASNVKARQYLGNGKPITQEQYDELKNQIEKDAADIAEQNGSGVTFTEDQAKDFIPVEPSKIVPEQSTGADENIPAQKEPAPVRRSYAEELDDMIREQQSIVEDIEYRKNYLGEDVEAELAENTQKLNSLVQQKQDFETQREQRIKESEQARQFEQWDISDYLRGIEATEAAQPQQQAQAVPEQTATSKPVTVQPAPVRPKQTESFDTRYKNTMAGAVKYNSSEHETYTDKPVWEMDAQEYMNYVMDDLDANREEAGMNYDSEMPQNKLYVDLQKIEDRYLKKTQGYRKMQYTKAGIPMPKNNYEANKTVLESDMYKKINKYEEQQKQAMNAERSETIEKYKRKIHGAMLNDAIDAGKTIPENILQDYPFLRKKYDIMRAKRGEIDNGRLSEAARIPDTEGQSGRGILVENDGRSVGAVDKGRFEESGSVGREDRRGIQGVLLITDKTVAAQKTEVSGVPVYQIEDGEAFKECIEEAKKSNPHAAFVYVYPAEEYTKKKLFLVDNGKTGVAVSDDGDIVSVFKNVSDTNGSKLPNVSSTLLLAALKNGGNKLDCYDSPNHFLPVVYARHGFVPVCKLKFDREYAAPDWNYERDGEPDIIFFVHNKDSVDIVQKKIQDKTYSDYFSYESIPYVNSYDEGLKYRDSVLKNNQGKTDNKPVQEAAATSEPVKTEEAKPAYDIKKLESMAKGEIPIPADSNELENLLREVASIPKERRTDIKFDLQLFAKKIQKEISKVYSNTFAQMGWTEEFKDILSDFIFSYDVLGEQEQTEKARERINKDRQGEIDRLETAETYDWNDTNITMELLKDAAFNGINNWDDYSMFLGLAKKAANIGTSGGRQIQAFAKYSRTEAGAIVAGQKAIDMAEKDFEQKKPNKAKQMNKEIKDATDALNKADKDSAKQAGAEVDTEISDLSPEEQLAKKIQAYLKQPKPPVRDIIRDMVDELFNVAKESPIEQIKPQKRSPYEFIVEAIEFREKYKQVWDDAKAIIEERYKDKPEQLARLEEYFDKGIRPPFSNKILDTVIKDAAKKLGINLMSVVMNKGETRKNLINYLVRESKFEGNTAYLFRNFVDERLSGMEEEFKAMVKKDPQADRLELIGQLFKDKLSETFAPPQIDKAIKEELRKRKVSISQLVKDYYASGKATQRGITDYIVKQSGLEGDSAKKLRDYIDRKFKDMRKQYADLYVNKLVEPKQKKEIPDFAKKIVEIANTGGFYNEQVKDLIKQKYGLPTLEKADVDAILAGMKEFKAMPEGNAKIDQYDKVMQIIADKMPSTALEKYNAWRRIAMLSSPRTHVRNIMGNVMMIPLRKTADIVEQGLEKAFRIPAEERTKSVGWSRDKGLVATVDKYWNDHNRELSSTRWEVTTSRGLASRKPIFKNPTLKAVNDFVFNSLEAEDALFYKRAYKDALGQAMKARGLTEVNQDVSDYALRKAQEATYKEMSDLASMINRLKKKRVWGPIVEAAMPFTKTPANIAKRFIEYSPLGLAKTLYDKVSGQTTKTVVESLSKGLTGTGVFLLGMLLSNLGWARGERKESEKAEALLNVSGEQANSIVTPLGSYTIDWAQPFAAPLMMGIIVNEALQKKDDKLYDTIFNAIKAGGDSIFDLSMLQNIKDLLGGKFGSPTEGILSMPWNFVSQAYPTVAGQAARVIDPTRRSTYDTSRLGIWARKQAAKVPGLSYTLEPYLDIFGREQKNGGPLEQFISPGYFVAKTDDKVTQEITRMYNLSGETDIIPKVAPRKLTHKGEDVILEPKELTAFQRQMGMTNYQKLSTLFNDPKYINASDSSKESMIKTIVKNSYDQAKRTLLQKRGLIAE